MGRKRTRLRISSMPNVDELHKRVKKVIDDEKFGKLCSKEWHNLYKEYIPRDTGQLARRVRYAPFDVIYDSKYAHYQYTGIVYEDPLYKVAGFKGKDGNWYSRKEVKKVARSIPTGNKQVMLRYKNPKAIDHWDLMAQKAGKDKILCQRLNQYLQNNFTN